MIMQTSTILFFLTNIASLTASSSGNGGAARLRRGSSNSHAEANLMNRLANRRNRPGRRRHRHLDGEEDEDEGKGSSKGRSSKGKGSSSDEEVEEEIGVFDFIVNYYENPPAGVVAGDTITGCEIVLTDNIFCTNEFDACLTLDATTDDVTLDCGGYSIQGFGNEQTGIEIIGDDPESDGHTVTLRNCIISGFGDCVRSRNGPYNLVIEDSAAIECTEMGWRLTHSGNGNTELTNVAGIANGADGFAFRSGRGSNGRLDLANIFACGNAKNEDRSVDLAFDGGRVTGVNITLDTSDDPNNLNTDILLETMACPTYAEETCVDVTMSSQADPEE